MRPSNGLSAPRARDHRFAVTEISPLAIGLLLLSTFVSLAWSHYRLLWGDEFYEIWTDSVSSVAQLVKLQLTSPVCLDPLAYHVIAHAATRVFGVNAFAIRLPALLGILLLQICLYIFLRRIATEWTAVFALGLLALTCVSGYSIEGRPYGLMLGAFGLAMVSWQTATLRESERAMALVCLAAALILALNTHYFGVLLLAPLCCAELFRSFQRQRLDPPVLASIGVGATGIVFALPFMKAAKEFHSIYGLGPLKLSAIVWPYYWTLSNRKVIHGARTVDKGMFVIMLVLVAVSLYACIRQLSKKGLLHWEPDEMFLVVLAALPLFGYFLASFSSPILEPRFVLGLIIGIVALTAIGLSSLFRSDRAGKFIIASLFAGVAFTGLVHIYLERIAARETIASMTLQPGIKTALMANSSRFLYIQDMENFGAATFYEPDPEVRSRIALLYSFDQEMKWNHSNVIALTAIHLSAFTNLKVVSFESLTAQPDYHLLVDFSQAGNWNWTGKALATTPDEVKQLGSAFCGNYAVMGEVLSIRFHP